MKKIIIYPTLIFLALNILACQSEKTPEGYKERKNYAVVWQWKITDQEHVLKNLTEQAQELNELWKKDIVENIYIDSEAEISPGEQFPDISFIIKAEDERAAKVYLDNMLFVRNKISTYSLYPVGKKFLGRNKEVLDVIGIKNSYAAVFKTIGKKDDIMALLADQNMKTMELWKAGKIENAYLDIDGYSSGTSTIPSMVFYVNANDEEKAKAILSELPFVKKKLTSYQLFPVGIFWMGQYENKSTN